jgi:single-stranded DNA-binding protein
LYPNRNDYKMYVVPTQPLQVIPKEVNMNQVNLAGGVGFIQEKKLEDLFAFSLMCKAPSQQLLGHTWQDSMGFRIESWGDDAKRLEALLYVGRQMALTGSMRYNTWTAQDGSQRGTYQVRVRASQYSVFGKNQPKTNEGQGEERIVKAAAPVPKLPIQQSAETMTVEEDGIPF